MARVLLVIAPSMFRDEEYAQPKRVLESFGHEVITASTVSGRCTGKLGMSAVAEVALSDALGDVWDGVAFIGGAGSSVFFDDPKAHRLARESLERGAVVAAICIAPSTLARAGLLDGVHSTAFDTQRADLVAHGAVWTGEDVTVDGRIVTANGPAAAVAFGDAIVGLL